MAEGTTVVQKPINCQFCKQCVIEWKCFQCDNLICSECKVKIHSLKSTQDHKIVRFEDLDDESGTLDLTNIKCKKHSGQKACLYCNECDVLVCPICASEIHKKHELVDIEKGYSKKRGEIEQFKIKLIWSRHDAKRKQCILSGVLNKENKGFDKVEEYIGKHEQLWKNAIDKYFAQLRGELSKTKADLIKSFDNDIKAISTFSDDIDKKITDVDELLGSTNAAIFFEEINNVMDWNKRRAFPLSTPSYRSVPTFVPAEIIPQAGVGQLISKESSTSEVNMKVKKRYQTNMSMVSYIVSCDDDTLWVGFHEEQVVQRVQTVRQTLKYYHTVNTEVYGMTLSQSNDLIIVDNTTHIKVVNSQSGRITESPYNIKPFDPTAIHETREDRVVVGGYSKEVGRGILIVIDKKGSVKRKYEYDDYNEPLFRYPKGITCTSNNMLHVADHNPDDGRGRVIVIGEGGEVCNIYHGHLTVNKVKPFGPECIVTTPIDNIIVTDPQSDCLHILNNVGDILTYVNTKDTGIEGAYSLAYSPSRRIFIGCTKRNKSNAKEAKLYEVNISGC